MKARNHAHQPRLKRQLFPEDGGFTLVEVLAAMGILVIGLLGIGLALSSSNGLAGGADLGLAAVSRGNSYSTATELAQARLEEIKNGQYTATGPVDQITLTNFGPEAYGDIAGYAGFRRTVTIQNGTPAAGMKTISVQVFFTPQYQTRRGSEEVVQVSTIIAQRP